MTELYRVTFVLLGLGFFVGNAASAVAAKAPKVVFIGDAITYYWGAGFAANPNWLNRGSAGPPDENAAAQILARFQSDVVNLHPALVHILAGTEDVLEADDASYALTVQNVQTSITAMVIEAKNANIAVVLGTIPPLIIGDSATTLQVYQPVLTLQINAWIEGYGLANHIPVVNYHDAVCACVGSTDPNDASSSMINSSGTIPSPAGYAAMTSLAETAIDTYGLPLDSGYLGNLASIPEERFPQTNVSTVPQGTSLQFTANGVFGHSVPGTMTNTDFAGLDGVWTSSNPSVMYVGYSGTAFASSPGTATISYTSPSGVPFVPWVMTVQAAE